MARKPRIHFSGAVYHVTLKGVDGERIFQKVSDRRAWEDLITDGTERFGHRILGYCWAKDHVQMAVEVNEAALSKIMQNLTFRYTRYYNTEHNRSGSLFHGRYRAILIDADQYLCELVSYIHNNPVRNTAAKRAADGKWTSYAGYADKKVEPEWLSTDRVLGLLNKSEKAARKALEKFTDAARESGYRQDLERGKNGEQILGSQSFVRKALKPPKETPQLMTANQLVKRVCKHEGVKESSLATQSRARAESQLRQIITYLAVELKVASMTDMARHFNRDLTTMSRNQRYFRDKLADDKPLQKQVKKLSRTVLAG